MLSCCYLALCWECIVNFYGQVQNTAGETAAFVFVDIVSHASEGVDLHHWLICIHLQRDGRGRAQGRDRTTAATHTDVTRSTTKKKKGKEKRSEPGRAHRWTGDAHPNSSEPRPTADGTDRTGHTGINRRNVNDERQDYSTRASLASSNIPRTCQQATKWQAPGRGRRGTSGHDSGGWTSNGRRDGKHSRCGGSPAGGGLC